MLQEGLHVDVLIPSKNQKEISKAVQCFRFSNKGELIALIKSLSFDILVSNGCPYILPVSKLKQDDQIFVNIHPSLLPRLRGPHPINGAIFMKEKTGATCHIMDDNIDSGDLIAQAEIYNDDQIDLPLLYQMCFLAEIQVFALALNQKFIPQYKPLSNSSYFKRNENNTLINHTDSLQNIYSKVQSFKISGQYARLHFKNRIFFINSAKIIENVFLENYFHDYLDNSIVLIYENFILVKKDNIFLELGVVDGVKDFAIRDLIFNPLQISIYQSLTYSKCYQNEQFKFYFSRNGQIFYNLSEISPIQSTRFNDMTSPYGYSGYFTNSIDSSFIQEALDRQKIEANKKNIIAEFIRFNPYQNHEIFSNFLDFYTLEKQIVEVSTNYQQRWNGYQSRLRGKIRKSLSLINVRPSNNLEKFHTLYKQTMQRNRAQEFYFFNLEYFKKLSSLKNFKMFEAIYKNEICAMAIFLIDGNRSYYHLGASSEVGRSNNLNAMCAIFESFFQYAEQNGIISCLLGGGRTADPNDSLLLYKKQYSPTLIDFYIGGKIYNHQAYEKLSKNFSNRFFLKYRYGNICNARDSVEQR